MAYSYFPFAGNLVAQSDYSLFFRELRDMGVLRSVGNRLAVTANSSGMRVTMATGGAIVRGHYFRSTASENITITAASTINPRIDTLVLRLDPTAKTLLPAVKTGTPAASPQPPTLTQTESGVYELPLADIFVAKSVASIASGAVTDRRTLAGSDIGLWDEGTRPAGGEGKLGYNRSTGLWEFHNGTTWQSISPTVTWGDVASKPATFPPTAHNHSAADVTSGTLPIARGGTGGTTQATARTALGITPANIGAAAVGHNHDDRYYTKAQSDSRFPPIGSQGGRAVMSINTANQIGLRWNGSRAVFKYDSTEFALASEAMLNSGLSGKADSSAVNGKANSFGDANTVRYTRGPDGTAYARSIGSAYYSVWMDDSLQFGRNVSSRRYKSDIAPAEVDVEAVLALEPVTFHRIADDEHPESRDLGLIAEDSTGVDHLVIYEDGRPEAVRYETVLPVALLAVTKAQQARIEALEARLAAIEGAPRAGE